MTRGELVALSEISLFRDVDILDLQNFFEESSLKVQNVPEGGRIASQGDSYEKLILILKGSAAASMAAPGGKMIRLETLKAPCAAATAILFSSARVLPVTLDAAEECEILKLPEDLVLMLMREFSSFLRAFLMENGDKLSFLTDKIRLFQFKSLRQKIAAYIMMLDGGRGLNTVNLQYTREELAQLMGAARPSLSREISAMTRDGLLECKGKNAVILDRSSLIRVIEEE